MNIRPIALWATPRTVSTAFERMMIERGDHVVLDEPFSRAYYFGPERESTRFDTELPDSSYGDVVDEIRAAAVDGPVFFKDMAYHLGPHVEADWLDEFENTFLIRDPAWAVPSLAKIWPDYTDDEVGYAALERLVLLTERRTGEAATILDSDAIRADPAGVIGRWCEAVGIPFLPDSLTWEPGMQPEWKLWRDWYEAAAASTGFQPPSEGDPPAPQTARERQSIAAAEQVLARIADGRSV